jgi:hypothetical protein
VVFLHDIITSGSVAGQFVAVTGRFVDHFEVCEDAHAEGQEEGLFVFGAFVGKEFFHASRGGGAAFAVPVQESAMLGAFAGAREPGEEDRDLTVVEVGAGFEPDGASALVEGDHGGANGG